MRRFFRAEGSSVQTGEIRRCPAKARSRRISSYVPTLRFEELVTRSSKSPNGYAAIVLPSGESAAAGQPGETRISRSLCRRLGPARAPQFELAALRPRGVDTAFARRNGDVLPFADPHFRVTGFGHEDLAFAAPGGDRRSGRSRQPSAVHRTGVYFPRPFAELLRLTEVRARYGTNQIEIPRAAETVPPHHLQRAALRKYGRRMAALADGTVG